MFHKYLYDNGLPFTDGVDINLKDCLERVMNRTASLIIIDGGLGQGKTTFMIHCLDYINKLTGKPPVDLNGCQFAMGGLEFEDKIDECFKKGFNCIGYDEGGDFNRKGALSRFNQLLNRIFQTIRAYNCVVFLTLPCFLVIDNDLYTNDIVQGCFHLYDKSQGKYGYFKLYDVHTLLYMKKIAKEHSNPLMVYNRVIPNLRGNFKDIEIERSVQLDKIGMSKKRNIKSKARIHYEGLVHYGDLSNKLFKSVDWCRRTVSNLKIKHVKEINRVKYFNPDVVALMADHIDQMQDKRK